MRSDANLTPQLKKAIEEMGPEFDHIVLAQTRAIFGPLVKDQQTGEVAVDQDLPYGSHDRQKLDIYKPSLNATDAPVLLFVPGGGFVGGDKAGPQGFYRNVGIYFARHGFVCAIMNYRLAPEFAWPTGSDDVAQAVDWIAGHIGAQGGDPDRIIVWGHSAGGAHVSGYLFHPRWEGKRQALKGGILMSAPYDFESAIRETPDEISVNIRAYAGADPEHHRMISPVGYVAGTLPVVVGVAELDPPFLVKSAFNLASAIMQRDGRAPKLIWMAGHNHVSSVQAIGSEVDDTGQMIHGALLELLDR